MIIAMILVYTALVFALGVMAGQAARRGDAALQKETPKAEFNTEILNFLNYDGTSQ